jgi:polar amino acid transport system substrate-binding protein
MSPDIIADLASTGVLRAGINLANSLLMSGRSPADDPEGVAPDMAREIAKRLKVPVKYVVSTAGELADQAPQRVWDMLGYRPGAGSIHQLPR